MRKLLITIAIAIGLIGFPSSAQAAPYDAAVIKYHSGPATSLLVCKNWGATTCKSGKAYLQKGKTTKQAPLKWVDADGFYVPSGTICTSTDQTGLIAGPKWVKQRGFFGATYPVTCFKK